MIGTTWSMLHSASDNFVPSPLPLSSTLFFLMFELEDTGAGAPHQCPLESAASYLCRFMLTCDVPMTHINRPTNSCSWDVCLDNGFFVERWRDSARKPRRTQPHHTTPAILIIERTPDGVPYVPSVTGFAAQPSINQCLLSKSVAS